MKKLLAIVLMLVLCAASLAEGGDMTSLVRAGGFEPVASENKSGILRCDYTLTGERTAAMVWTDAAQQYTVSGDSDALSKLYLDALDLGGWESCRYIVGEEARLSFGTVSAQRCESLEDYAALVRAAMAIQSFASAFTGVTRSYVLNKRSKKFHHPECPGIKNMSLKNREEFTGTRNTLIAQGYSPCGICKP
ncbi:MAG: hypothetical protein IJI71_16145 [Clostridia bacterium]|nr:hypothetical protein [Clostridia bacterium]